MRHNRFDWKKLFVWVGIGALLGGTFHGFVNQWPLFWEIALWKFTILAIGPVGWMLYRVTYQELYSYILSRRAYWLSLSYYLIFMIAALIHSRFYVVMIYYGPILIVSMVLFFRSNTVGPTRHKGVAIGLLLSILSALIQVTGVSINEWLNHNDLYHYAQAVAFIVISNSVSKK
ncbi:MAG: hypothetical protein KDD25_01950 [Bdellovibrionales bacterium]|nr:hypothetical protein [Bdellovibrionales bacterium]